MKSLTAILAFTGFTVAAPSGAAYCGKCDPVPGPHTGGNAQIALRTSANKDTGKAYQCTAFDKGVHLSNCSNQFCGICMVFKDDDCREEVLHWGGPGSSFDAKDVHSYFCM